MTIWTTFCPSKICWELTYAVTHGQKPTSDWLDNQELIRDSLKLLKKHGIAGIRLVIFPSEVTTEGKKFDWTAVETMLDICYQQKILVDLCLGPYQYPYYPGIYLPPQLLSYVYDNENALDTNPELRRYGIAFLQLQLEKYGQDKRIRGFHLANEWPDKQNISGKEKLKKSISEDFMIKAASLVKISTEKPISLNTNISVSDKKKLTNTLTNILTIIGEQANLGFDIYPSQETWIMRLIQMIRRIFESSSYTLRQVKKSLKDCTLYFAEVEAQPWGNGRSWYSIINSAINPQQKVLSYSSIALQRTWNTYIKGTNCEVVSLWGADFWLVANELGITWPLKAVKSLSSQAA
jgi:hypothetical protein